MFIAKKYVDLRTIEILKAKEPQAQMSEGVFVLIVAQRFKLLKTTFTYTFLKAGTLDDSSWVKIDSNFFTKSANNWDDVDKSIKCFDANPGFMLD